MAKIPVLLLLAALPLISCKFVDFGAPKHQPSEKSSRIIGGSVVQPGKAPYQCSVRAYGNHVCSCAILSDQWVLTGVNCLGTTNVTDIFVGSVTLDKAGRFYAPAEFVYHPRYLTGGLTLAYLVVLVRLAEKLQFDENVQPIELSTNLDEDGSDAVLTGWGPVREGFASSPVLRAVNLTTVSTENCKNYFGFLATDAHICTIARVGEGSCRNDRASPLVVKNKLVGISDGVFPPCGSGFPDKHHKVAFFHDWIVSVMNKPHAE